MSTEIILTFAVLGVTIFLAARGRRGAVRHVGAALARPGRTTRGAGRAFQ
jgi:hypothetical protein